MLQNIINYFNLNPKNNLSIDSTLLLTAPFFAISGILICIINYISKGYSKNFIDMTEIIVLLIYDLIFVYLAFPLAALAFAVFLGSLIKYTIIRHTIMFGVFFMAMYPIFTFDAFNLFFIIAICAPAALGLLASALMEIKLKKQLPTEPSINSPAMHISKNVLENTAPTNIIDKIISRFTLDKTNKLPAFYVSSITLLFVAFGLLIASIPALTQFKKLSRFAVESAVAFAINDAFSIYWLIVSFLTALVVRFTSNTIVNYTLLGATWLFLFALQQEFNLEYVLLNKVSLLSIGTLLIIGLVAIAYIELKLKKKLLDDSFLK